MYELVFADTFHGRACVAGEGVSAHKPAADDIDLALDHDRSKLAAQTLRTMESKTQKRRPKQGPNPQKAARLRPRALPGVGRQRHMVCRAADQK